MKYQYPHFRRQLIAEDGSFHGGPGPGDPFPMFDLPTADGGRVRNEDFLGRPLLITLASSSCPMTANSSPDLKRLYDEFGDRVAFLSLYVREAHPGEHYFQPEIFEQKLTFARDYQRRDQIPWPVAVDDIEGTLHQALDQKPNSAYLLDPHGRVAQRVLWSNDIEALREGLEAIVSGRRPAHEDQQRKLVPMLRGMGQMYEVLGQAGSEARRDVLRQVPPLYMMARLADLFRPLPPLGRGIAATATVAAGLACIAVAGWRTFRRR